MLICVYNMMTFLFPICQWLSYNNCYFSVLCVFIYYSCRKTVIILKIGDHLLCVV